MRNKVASAYGLKDRRHGVSGIHAAAGTHAWTGAPLDLQKLVFVDRVGGILPDRLKGAHDGEITTFVVAWLDGAAVDKDRWDVQAGNGNHRTWCVLVTATKGEYTVHALTAAYGFYGIGDHLA